MKNWVAWHADYDDPASALSGRLHRVREHLSEAISTAPAGPVRLVSLCAGQGRDVIGVLPAHPRAADVRAVLVELDPANAAFARRSAQSAGLTQVQVREADASLVSGYADALPADILLLCGIFGNVSAQDIERTAQVAPALCADGATVIWTRHRREPDMTPRVRAWFAASGFDEIAFDALDNRTLTGIWVGRLRSGAQHPPPPEPLFTFRNG